MMELLKCDESADSNRIRRSNEIMTLKDDQCLKWTNLLCYTLHVLCDTMKRLKNYMKKNKYKQIQTYNRRQITKNYELH